MTRNPGEDQSETMAMSDKILLLNFGKIEQQGTPEEMYSRPQTQFTAELMGSNTRLPGKVATITERRALLDGEGWEVWGWAFE
jgi:iron(III) transport system ATP-binding protein